MARPTRIHHGKQPKRLHYIVEWAERRQLSQAEIAEALSVDKSSVSRWFKGTLPAEAHLYALAKLFELDGPAALFHHPDGDWLLALFRNRSTAERKRIMDTIEIAFPRRA